MEATSVTLNRTEFHQTYVLRCQRDETVNSPQPGQQKFEVYTAADAAHPRGFDSIEQVLNFLLDELFGSTGSREETELRSG